MHLMRAPAHPSCLTSHGLHKHHLIISRSVEVRDSRNRVVSSAPIERPGARVLRPTGGLDHDEPGRSLRVHGVGPQQIQADKRLSDSAPRIE
jgi:hypothetical protein